MKKLLQQEKLLAKVLITGSRYYSDYGSVARAISIIIGELANEGYKEITFLQGGAKGADSHAVEFINKVEKSIFRLIDVKLRYETYLPDWQTHGKAAGPMRNQKMIEQGPVHALVFLQKDEANVGTLGTVKKLRKAGVPFTPYGAVELLDKVA